MINGNFRAIDAVVTLPSRRRANSRRLRRGDRVRNRRVDGWPGATGIVLHRRAWGRTTVYWTTLTTTTVPSRHLRRIDQVVH